MIKRCRAKPAKYLSTQDLHGKQLTYLIHHSLLALLDMASPHSACSAATGCPGPGPREVPRWPASVAGPLPSPIRVQILAMHSHRHGAFGLHFPLLHLHKDNTGCLGVRIFFGGDSFFFLFLFTAVSFSFFSCPCRPASRPSCRRRFSHPCYSFFPSLFLAVFVYPCSPAASRESC